MTKHSNSVSGFIRDLAWALAVLSVVALVLKLLKDRLSAGKEADQANAWSPAVPEQDQPAAPVSRFPGGFNRPDDSSVQSQDFTAAEPRGEQVSGLQMEVAPLVPADEASLAEEAPGETEPRAAGMPHVGGAETTGPDDLKIIEGIGPKTETVLHAAGITTFRQLADTTVERLEEITRSAGLNLARPKTWPEQAGLAAQNRMDELQRLMDDIKGGEKVDEDE